MGPLLKIVPKKGKPKGQIRSGNPPTQQNGPGCWSTRCVRVFSLWPGWPATVLGLRFCVGLRCRGASNQGEAPSELGIGSSTCFSPPDENRKQKEKQLQQIPFGKNGRASKMGQTQEVLKGQEPKKSFNKFEPFHSFWHVEGVSHHLARSLGRSPT